MEIVAGTTRQHPQHGPVRIESIYRKYGVVETDEDITGHIPGGWYARVETTDDESIEVPIEEFQ